MQDLTIGQWLFMRLWVEEQLRIDISAIPKGVAQEVLGRCFGCTTVLPEEEMQTADGLCEDCLAEERWKRN
jgi:hypothetical protein